MRMILCPQEFELGLQLVVLYFFQLGFLFNIAVQDPVPTSNGIIKENIKQDQKIADDKVIPVNRVVDQVMNQE